MASKQARCFPNDNIYCTNYLFLLLLPVSGSYIHFLTIFLTLHNVNLGN